MDPGTERVHVEMKDSEGEPVGVCLRWYNRTWCLSREDAEIIHKKLGEVLKDFAQEGT